MANCLVLTKVDADPAPFAEQSRPRGRLVLPIFIPQGWPPAMSHLPWIGSQAPCYPASSQVAQHREGRSYVLSPRSVALCYGWCGHGKLVPGLSVELASTGLWGAASPLLKEERDI